MRGPRGRRVVALPALILAAALLAPTGAAEATDGPSTLAATLLTPAASSTVSGQVTVTARITADPRFPVTDVTFDIEAVLQQRVVPAAGECASTCDLTVTFDTAAYQPPKSLGEQSIVPDGPDEVSVTARDSSGGMDVTDMRTVTVDA